MAHDGTSHPDLPNAPGLTSSEPTPLPNAPGLTSVVPENVEDLVESPISPDVVSAAMPSEPVCPKIPGIPSFPEAPDPAAFGKLASDKVDSKADAVSESYEDLQKKAKEKKDRIKNPPSPSDMMDEMATQVSSAAEKAAKALEKAAIDAKNQVQENLAAEWDKIANTFTELESAMEAVSSGAVDLGSLGMDVLSIPGDALAAAFPGFKSAKDCLLGETGSAKAEFNAKSGKLSEGLAEGNGLSATAADDEITKQSEDTTDENGNKIRKQKTISREDAEKSVEGTTKTAVPQSDDPIATEKEAVEEEEKALKVGVYPGSTNEFYTQSGRKLNSEETARAFAGLPPKFTRPPMLISEKKAGVHLAIPPAEEGDSLDVLQAKFDAWWLDFQGHLRSRKGNKAEDKRLKQVAAYKNRGEPVPAKLLKPILPQNYVQPPNYWYKDVSWHAASYYLGNPPPEVDGTQIGGSGSKPLISSSGKYYYWFNGALQ